MADRPLLALLTVSVAALLLTGCTAESEAAAELPPAPPVDLCSLAAPSGAASDAVSVAGTAGSPAAVTFTTPLTILGIERTVVVEGAGEEIDSASLIHYAMTVFDAATGEQLQSRGYDGTPTLPTPAANLGQVVGCATMGSRIVVAAPETDADGATVTVLDLLGAEPARATGAEQKPVKGMPTVELDEAGAPTVTIPAADPPADPRVAVLKKGDGAVVAAGGTVMVHQTSTRWSNGTMFESTWSQGAPTALVTTDLIAAYREALEGQSVGSQVLVVIPPKFAYGEGEINEFDLTGETIVIVADILATVPAP